MYVYIYDYEFITIMNVCLMHSNDKVTACLKIDTTFRSGLLHYLWDSSPYLCIWACTNGIINTWMWYLTWLSNDVDGIPGKQACLQLTKMHTIFSHFVDVDFMIYFVTQGLLKEMRKALFYAKVRKVKMHYLYLFMVGCTLNTTLYIF